jgi:hypothetical protein
MPRITPFLTHFTLPWCFLALCTGAATCCLCAWFVALTALCPCSIHTQFPLQVEEIISNSRLSERFLSLARDLDVMEAKLPEDVYKMHLVDTQRSGLPNPIMESGMRNLSASIVNALLNVGFGVDKMVTAEEKEGEKTWVSRNKDHGKICAVASIGVRVPRIGWKDQCAAVLNGDY